MSFTEHNVGGLIFDTSDAISAVPGVVHAFTTRHGGVSPAPFDSLNFADHHGDTNENLLENYRRLGAAVGFDASRAVACRQIHSDHVCVAREEDAGKLLWDERLDDGDALITNVPNLPLFAYGTDCCVITLYDPSTRCIGAVHAGWRGTASGIALKTAVTMMSYYGADPYTLRAAKDTGDISGVWENGTTLGNGREGDVTAITTENGGLWSRWFDGDMQYSLYAEGAAMDDYTAVRNAMA